MKFPKFKDLILFEDNDVIVINKPPFISSVEERNNSGINILKLAKEYFPEAQVCHRLDKETSGCLIIAKNPESYRDISIQFEKRKVDKTYHAIIDGNHVFENLNIKLPILLLGKGLVKIDKKEGKEAETIFNSIKFYRHYTLVECKPVTGRMHQIRIHLASQRASISGDEAYGGKEILLSKIKRKYNISENEEEQAIMKRFALHSFQIKFLLNDRKYEIEAPYPKDFATAIKLLDKFDS